MSDPIVLPSFGGDARVGSIATQYPFQPGVDVTNVLGASQGAASTETVKIGTVSVSVAAAGTASGTVAFAAAFPTSTDSVMLTLGGLGGAVINGGPVAASITATGFDATVDVTTAGTGDVTVYWMALGH